MSLLSYQTITLLARLTTMVGAAPLLAPVVKLYQNDFTPDENSILADFTVATFGNYADSTGPFGAAGLDPNGVPVAARPFTFSTDATPTGVAYGLYVLDSTGALVAAGRFENAPYNFAVNGDQLVGVIQFSFQEGTITIAIGP